MFLLLKYDWEKSDENTTKCLVASRFVLLDIHHANSVIRDLL